MEKTKSGLILVIDENGVISEVKRNDFPNFVIGNTLLELADAMSIGKVLSFLSTLKDEGSVIGWELNLKQNNKIIGMFFSGSKSGKNYIVVASPDLSNSRRIFNELMIVNNEQVNVMRKVIKENVEIQKEMNKTEHSFNEMTSLNNEMANMQRELAKKNHALNKLNEVLEKKNAELDQFAYIVSHDLKAPLRGITSLLEMIQEDYADELDSDLQEMFGKIISRSSRMNELISAILAYSKASKVDSKTSKFHLKEMILELIDSIAAPKGFNFILPEDLPVMNCSYVQLGQVLTNLIGNAVKYHDKDSGNIELKIDFMKNDFIRFSIKDDGPGIPEKYHEKLFGMFETANIEKREDSTGVGLAIVKKLVEQMDGEIGLNSEVGKGSEFWFTWPHKN